MSSSPPSPGKQEETGRRDELTELLADVEWMRSRLHAGGVAGLLTDYTSIPEQPELALVQETILLSAHVLAVDPDQFPAQLAGRTIGRCELARARLHAVARAWPHAAWLCPIRLTLAQPGEALRRTLTGHTGMVLGVAVSADGRTAVSGSWIARSECPAQRSRKCISVSPFHSGWTSWNMRNPG